MAGLGQVGLPVGFPLSPLIVVEHVERKTEQVACGWASVKQREATVGDPVLNHLCVGINEGGLASSL